MLPSKNRLHIPSFKTKSIDVKKLEDANFNLFFKNAKGVFRAATVVSKKVAPQAVDRNRIKRVISEVLQSSNLQGEYLIKVKANIAKLKKNEVDTLLKKLINIKK